jgi:Zn-finger nucleic acid-binding protein
MADRQGVEIDYCPTCRGVWLDRGELDKIIERNAASQAPQQPASPPQPQAPPPPGGPWGAQPQQYGHGYGHKPYKRRKSFLEDLFD